jgi:aminopeptidase N
MKTKITQLLLCIAFFAFSQKNNTEFNQMVEAEMKSASSLQQVLVNANTQNYDVLYHELRFTVNPSQSTISGVVTTTFKAVTNMNTLVFDMATALAVSSVTMNGVSLTKSQSNYELNITLPSTLMANDIATVVITYAGTPPTAEGAFSRNTHNGTPVLWTLSEPFGARDWWPCKQDLNDKINKIDVYITAPSQYNAVSNGLQKSRTVSGSNATTWFQHNYKIPAYLVAIAVTNYETFNQQGGLGTPESPFFPIVNYLYPEESASSQASLAVTPDIINFFETKIGPYPFRNEKYGHARAGLGGGMEHTTVSFMNSWGRELISHELAHQWFGNKITCGSWKDIWLNEGVTEYMSGLVVENFDGNDNFTAWKQLKNNSITSSSTGALYLSDTEALNVSRIFSSRITYNKGSMVTHMLRWKLGDTNFFQALKNYLDSPLAYSYAITTDFKSYLEAASQTDLTEFFDDWVYGQGYPTYNVTAQNFGAGQAKITVNQTRTANANTYFEMPLEIRLLGAAGQVKDVVVNNTVNAEEFIVSVPFVVSAVQFDPNVQIISKNSSAALSNNSFNLEQTVSLFPIPAKNEINIQLPSNIEVLKTEVYNNLGQTILEGTNKNIDLTAFSEGIHWLKITTTEGVVHKKFIKN